MRDTHAPMLINQIGKVSGLNIKAISQQLGHANVQTTLNVYAHAGQESDTLVADAIKIGTS